MELQSVKEEQRPGKIIMIMIIKKIIIIVIMIIIIKVNNDDYDNTNNYNTVQYLIHQKNLSNVVFLTF